MVIFSGAYSHLYYFPFFLILSSITLLVGFAGYTLSKSSDNLRPLKSIRIKNQKQDYKKLGGVIEKLIFEMKTNKYYLDQELSLKSFAEKIGIHENLISKAINQKLHVNFHEFVNNYRIEEFIHRISKDKNKKYTFLAHAFDSGFSSKSSFNYLFKKKTNKTPSEFFKDLHKKNDTKS